MTPVLQTDPPTLTDYIPINKVFSLLRVQDNLKPENTLLCLLVKRLPLSHIPAPLGRLFRIKSLDTWSVGGSLSAKSMLTLYHLMGGDMPSPAAGVRSQSPRIKSAMLSPFKLREDKCAGWDSNPQTIVSKTMCYANSRTDTIRVLTGN